MPTGASQPISRYDWRCLDYDVPEQFPMYLFPFYDGLTAYDWVAKRIKQLSF